MADIYDAALTASLAGAADQAAYNAIVIAAMVAPITEVMVSASDVDLASRPVSSIASGSGGPLPFVFTYGGTQTIITPGTIARVEYRSAGVRKFGAAYAFGNTVQVTPAGQLHRPVQAITAPASLPLGGPVAADRSVTFVADAAGSNVPHRFWVGFGAGDIAAGNTLIAKIAGASIAAQQYDQVVTIDGYIRSAVFRVVLPVVTSGQTVKIDVSAQAGVYSPSVAGTIADVTALDSKIVLSDVLDSADAVVGSGTWTASANDWASVPASVQTIAAGPVCSVYRGYSKFKDGATTHRDLTCDAIIEVWRHAGAIISIVESHHPRQGWINLTGGKGYSYTAKHKRGGTDQQSFAGVSTTFAPGAVTTGSTTAAKIAGISAETGQCVRFSSTGSLPAPLSASKTYWLRQDGSGNHWVHDVQYLCTTASDSNVVSLSTQGTGTHTVTTMIPHGYHSGWYARGADGKEFSTGNAFVMRPAWTAAERTAFADSGFFYQYDLTTDYSSLAGVSSSGPPADGQRVYFPGGIGMPPSGGNPNYASLIRPSTDSTGDHATLYAHGQYCALAWHRMTPADLQNMRVLGLIRAHADGIVLDETINAGRERATILPCNASTYSGLSAPTGWQRAIGSGFADWTAWNTGSGSVYADRGNVGGMSADMSHQSPFGYLNYLLTGDAHMIDAQIQQVQDATTRTNNAAGQRVKIVSGTTYYALAHWQQTRPDGYLIRDLTDAAAMVPDSWPEAQYCRDWLDGTLAFVVANREFRGADYKAMGVINKDAVPYLAPWVASHIATAYVRTKAFRGTANATAAAQQAANAINTFATQTHGGDGYFAALYYYDNLVPSGPTFMPASDWGYESNVSFTSGTNIVTYSAAVLNGTFGLANGDQMWVFDGAGGLTSGTKYYVVNINTGAGTHQLSLTAGGAAIALTSAAGRDVAYICRRTNATGFANSTASYPTTITAAAAAAVRRGLLSGSVEAMLRTRLTQHGSALSTDPRWNVRPA